MDFSETELIEKLKKGDEKSYEYIFKTYYPSLVVFAKKYLFELETGKEIVQDLFVKLYENRDNLSINSSLKSYLFASVRNKCLTYISQSQLRERHHESMINENKEASFVDVDYLEKTELEERIFKAISLLPDQCEKIFRMNRLDGKKNKEIAEELNISIRTVEGQITKALKILRESLSRYILLVLPFVRYFIGI